jgi:starch phosphorylase
MDTAASLVARLHGLARNLWWTWQPDVIAIFRDLDPDLWREVNHNPITFLGALAPAVLERRAEQIALDSRVNLAYRRLERYLNEPRTWGQARCGILRVHPVAYFSAEFALHESLPIYSGGLGVLAGDHLKSASDLGIPLVGVGIFYGEGYFQQEIDASGWQQERYGQVDLGKLPLRRATGEDGQPVLVDLPLAGGLRIGAWRADVGRASLILLDADLDGNPPALRRLTSQLYGGDVVARLRQEIVLGMGGIRMLRALGIRPGVLHLNEGHSAFAPLELARQLTVDEAIPFAEAHRRVARRTVFTTHTPVAAGHDRFTPDTIVEHLDWLGQELGIGTETLVGLGRVDPSNETETFCMTVLALRCSRYANAVSALHGHVSRDMWHALWPERAECEVPIGHITNGVHIPSWLAPQMGRLCDTYLGAEWRSRMLDAVTHLERIDEAAFWETHQLLKRHMLNYIERRCGAQGAPVPHLDGEVLTLTFARRFAEYKRATLLFTDLDRLARLVTAPGRGLQIIFAGKAHPRDEIGKHVLQRVVGLARDPRFQNRLVFIEDYDFSVSRHLVQGSDVWLNTPRRPLEACGTSGQKVVLNGGLNLSVLDGWWAEAYDGENGFAIGEGLTHGDAAVQDARDATALYDVLEHEVTPLYYARDAAGLPRPWIARVRHAVATLTPRFNADRMVRDYVLACYLPAAGAASRGMPRSSS